MKYTNLFLAFCLTASVWTGLSAADDAAAKARAEAKAKAEAEAAKKKAYQDLCNANRMQYNKLRSQLIDLGNAKKFSEMEKTADEIFTMYGKDGVTKNLNDYYNVTVRILNRDRKNNALLIKKYLEKFVKMTEGDTKVDYITELATLLKEQKLMKPEEIKAVQDIRAKVPGISDKTLFKLALEESDLKKADAIAQKMLADPALKSKPELLNRQIIPAFLKFKVYGSDYANKYYNLLIEAETNPDAKARAITAYAAFLKKFVIVSDEEANKLLDSRYTLAISPGLKAEFQIADLDRCETQAQIKEQFLKLYGEFKDSPQNRAKLLRRLTLAHWDSRIHISGDWIVPFMEETVLEDRELMNIAGDQVLGIYRGKCVMGRHDEAIAFARRKYDPLKNEVMRLAPAHIAIAKAVWELDAKVRAKHAEQHELNKAVRAEKDPAAKKKLEAQAAALNKEIGTLNTQLTKDREALKENNQKWDPVFREFTRWNNHLYSIYKDISRRYYDKENPYCLKQMNQLDADMLAATGTTDMMRLTRMAEHARGMGDLEAAAKFYRQAADRKQKDPKADTFNITVAYAGALFDNGEYARTLELAVPLLDDKRHENYKYELYRIVAFSCIAIRDYEAAIPVMEKWISLNRDYMQERYKVQIKDLKKRAEMQKAKAAK